jgi:transcriptional regulator with XRE-family HTH domain
MTDELTTDELNHEIKTVTDIEDFLEKNKEQLLRQSLPEQLNALLAQKGISRADVVRGSLLDRAYVYQIFSGEKAPSRDKLIAIAFGLCLSVDETQKMLKWSGHRELYPKDKRDALIMFTLQRQGDISDANDLLYTHKLETLGIKMAP